jgi:hypothetical protein
VLDTGQAAEAYLPTQGAHVVFEGVVQSTGVVPRGHQRPAHVGPRGSRLRPDLLAGRREQRVTRGHAVEVPVDPLLRCNGRRTVVQPDSVAGDVLRGEGEGEG